MIFSIQSHAWKFCHRFGFCFFAFSEPVSRRQNNPSLFDTHRSRARRSHIRWDEIYSFNKWRPVVNKIQLQMKECDSWAMLYWFRLSHLFRVKKHAIHSSDTTSSSDEERFERRKSKSMSRARNRCCLLLPSSFRLFKQLFKDNLRSNICGHCVRTVESYQN